VKIDDVHTFSEKNRSRGGKNVKVSTLSGCKQLIQNAEKENTDKASPTEPLAKAAKKWPLWFFKFR
jgi:hypothetical protein